MLTEERYAVHPGDFRSYGTTRIREEFLFSTPFVEDQISLVYSLYDRFIVGGAMPIQESLKLETFDSLKADYFLERREIGIVNIGGPALIKVDGNEYEVKAKEALYIGKGAKEVLFSSSSAKEPAKLYINSAPAHHTYPTQLITEEQSELVVLGDLKSSNHRTIRKLIVNSIVQTCQLQMGITELHEGSVWNTMPAHYHNRRMEAYFYFEVPDEQAVCHFMGQPEATRPIWVHNEQIVICPSWSIHCGSGTSRYAFIWGMAGENLDYGDMDKTAIKDLK